MLPGMATKRTNISLQDEELETLRAAMKTALVVYLAEAQRLDSEATARAPGKERAAAFLKASLALETLAEARTLANQLFPGVCAEAAGETP